MAQWPVSFKPSAIIAASHAPRFINLFILCVSARGGVRSGGGGSSSSIERRRSQKPFDG
jgi:hypothetical protein